MALLKIIGIVFAAILVLILLLILSPVDFRIRSKSGSDIEFSLYFLKVIKLGLNKKESKSKENDGAKNEKKKKGLSEKTKRILGIDKFDSIKTLKFNLKESGIEGTFGKTVEVIKFLISTAKDLIKKIRLKNLRILYISASADAASTAINYGEVCAVVYPLTSYIEQFFKGKKNFDVDICCDFDREKPYFETDLKVSLSVICALICFVRVLNYLNENERRENVEK
ncbi:MAG: DUF2953 domain-containing protein [Clostridia bacterium]|nr:DUF2953 domain-containing protein [Clostridia bacterium]